VVVWLGSRSDRHEVDLDLSPLYNLRLDRRLSKTRDGRFVGMFGQAFILNYAQIMVESLNPDMIAIEIAAR
jgi:hypothetical protein